VAIDARSLGTSSVIKRLTFLRRAPDQNAEEFASRWRASSLNNLEALTSLERPIRLVHCVSRVSAPESSWDGVEISWHSPQASETDLEVWSGAGSSGDIFLGGSRTIVTVEERTVSGAEWLADRWRQGGEMGAVLIGLVEAANGFTYHDFRDYWWDRHRPFANDLVPDELAPVAYVHDYVVEDSVAGGEFTWAGIGEMYERSLNTARLRGQWFESDAAKPLIADEERFLVRATRQVLVTSGEVLFDQTRSQ
jgi:hypothetical protein